MNLAIPLLGYQLEIQYLIFSQLHQGNWRKLIANLIIVCDRGQVDLLLHHLVLASDLDVLGGHFHLVISADFVESELYGALIAHGSAIAVLVVSERLDVWGVQRD